MSKTKKNFNEWLKKPKVKIKETPRSGDLIVQLYVEKESSRLFTSGNLVDGGRKYKIQPYPYAVVLKVNEEDAEYKEGDVVYLTDNILLTETNPDWISWKEKIENQKPTPHDPEPPRNIGGLNELSMFRFKKDKFKRDSEEIDEELYQIPIRVVRGKYEV